MKTARIDTTPDHTALAGVVGVVAFRGFVLLAGMVPAPITRH